VNIFDVDSLAMDKLERNLSSNKKIKINRKSSTAEAVKGVDIVSTVTADKRWATILEPEMIEPGMHINAIGGDCPGKTELHIDVLRKSKIFVEYEPQTRIEGDIQQLPKDHPVTELWEVLSKAKAGRDNDQQITVFDSVGFALEDYSGLRYLYELSEKTGVGQDIDLVPSLADPKDLYELVAEGSNVALAQKAG
jgi:ornithine cyclodeaminase